MDESSAGFAVASAASLRSGAAAACASPPVCPQYAKGRTSNQKEYYAKGRFGGYEAQRAQTAVALPLPCQAQSFASLTSPKWGIGRPLAGRDADEHAARIENRLMHP